MDILSLNDIERSTAHRLLQSLVAEGLVFQGQESKRYFLGMAMYEMGVAVPARDLRDVCQPYVMSIAQDKGDTVFLTIRSGFDGICVDRKQGGSPIAFIQEAGRSRPLMVGAGGLAILSALDDHEVTHIWAENLPRVRQSYPSYTQTEIDALLCYAREHGYVLTDVPGEAGYQGIGNVRP